jgi:hypothetical protein
MPGAVAAPVRRTRSARVPLAERVRRLLERLPARRRVLFLDVLRHEIQLELQAAKHDVQLEEPRT